MYFGHLKLILAKWYVKYETGKERLVYGRFQISIVHYIHFNWLKVSQFVEVSVEAAQDYPTQAR